MKDLEQKYTDVKNKKDQLSDEMEQLKVGGNNWIKTKLVCSWQWTVIGYLCYDQEEQVKAEAERNVLEQTFKILEAKLKAHDNNIKTMRENLSCKEQEKEVLTILYCSILGNDMFVEIWLKKSRCRTVLVYVAMCILLWFISCLHPCLVIGSLPSVSWLLSPFFSLPLWLVFVSKPYACFF